MKYTVLLFLSLAALNAMAEFAESGRNLAAPTGAEGWDELIGRWEVRGLNQDPSSPPRAVTDAYYILDGYVIQEDYRGLNAAGKVVFRGTSIRTYDPIGKHWAIQWVVAGSSDYTLIFAKRKGDEITSEGRGVNRSGEFLETYRISEITENSHRFELNRSYDGGETWSQVGANIQTRIAEDGAS